MKKILVLSTLLLLSACGHKYTGLGSEEFQVTSITFHDTDLATITGFLPSGKPADFLHTMENPQIQGVTLCYSSLTDTTGLELTNNEISFPLFIEHQSQIVSSNSSHFIIKHNGLFWQPDYSIRAESGARRIYATAIIENNTTQVWETDTVRLIDPDNNLITTATGSITVRPGSNPIPWWNAPASTPMAIIKYGWPVPGRWNPMIAFYCPSSGKVEEWGRSTYLSNDTIWFPADSLVTLNLTWEQKSDRYNCFLEITSQANQQMHWTIQWPERLPRGAEIDPGINSFNLSPNESTTILYKEIY